MASGSGIAGRYEILWRGHVGVDALHLEHDATAGVSLTAKDRREMQAMVERRIAAGQIFLRGDDGTMPPLYRLLGFEARGPGLLLRTGLTDYPEYLYTNVEHPERLREVGESGMANALALSAVVVTADEKALAGRRSAGLPESRGRYHVAPSGHFQPPQGLGEGVLAELEEETGLTADDVEQLCCTGLIQSTRNVKPELTFFTRTALSFGAVRTREPEDSWEFEELEGIPFGREELAHWLVAGVTDTTPPGHAALLLAGGVAYGEPWFEDVVARIAGESY